MSKKNMFDDYILDKNRKDESVTKSTSTKSEETPARSASAKDSQVLDHQQKIDEDKAAILDKLSFPRSILPWQNIDSNMTRQLLKAGYTSVKLLATATTGEIVSMTNIPRSYVDQLIANAKDWEDFHFETAANLLSDRTKLKRISTGSSSLDRLLGGGVEPRSITEFYGSYTTGKTQLSIQLAVNATLEEDGKGHAVYIDTEGSFRPERIEQICEEANLDAESILNRIYVGRAHNTTIQMELTNAVSELATNQSVKLLILDSLTSNFRAEYIGKGSIMDRQQKLNQHVQQLARISDMLNIAVVITNQVMSVIDGFENSLQPVGGNILAHGSTHRVELTKSKKHNQVRYAKLIASPSLPESTAEFKITRGGIKDVNHLSKNT